jgi:hypothetical protein
MLPPRVPRSASICFGDAGLAVAVRHWANAGSLGGKRAVASGWRRRSHTSRSPAPTARCPPGWCRAAGGQAVAAESPGRPCRNFSPKFRIPRRLSWMGRRARRFRLRSQLRAHSRSSAPRRVPSSCFERHVGTPSRLNHLSEAIAEIPELHLVRPPAEGRRGRPLPAGARSLHIPFVPSTDGAVPSMGWASICVRAFFTLGFTFPEFPNPTGAVGKAVVNSFPETFPPLDEAPLHRSP